MIFERCTKGALLCTSAERDLLVVGGKTTKRPWPAIGRCTKVHHLDTDRDKGADFWRTARSPGALLCTSAGRDRIVVGGKTTKRPWSAIGRCTKVHLLDTGRDKDAVFWRVVRSLGALLCTFWTLRLMAARGFGVPISHQVPFYGT